MRWAFDDAIAADICEGRVMKLEIVVRFEHVKEFGDGKRWVTSLLEVGRLHD